MMWLLERDRRFALIGFGCPRTAPFRVNSSPDPWKIGGAAPLSTLGHVRLNAEILVIVELCVMGISSLVIFERYRESLWRDVGYVEVAFRVRCGRLLPDV
jgi:hypothetical protein